MALEGYRAGPGARNAAAWVAFGRRIPHKGTGAGMEQETDQRLVASLLGDDPGARDAALAALFDRHQRRVYNVAVRVLGDRDAAQDVVQEIFLTLARRVRTWRGDAAFSSWLYRATVNRAIDRRRREGRRAAASLDDMAVDLETASLPGRPDTDESHAGERAEAAQQVQRALLRLSPKLRAVAVLRYVEGLTYEQLAEVLDCSIGTVKSRLNRAHQALQDLLGDAP